MTPTELTIYSAIALVILLAGLFLLACTRTARVETFECPDCKKPQPVAGLCGRCIANRAHNERISRQVAEWSRRNRQERAQKEYEGRLAQRQAEQN